MQMLKEQQGKDDRIKIVERNVNDEEGLTGFKNFDNVPAE